MSGKPQPSTTLTVVDLHNELCPGGALAVPEGDVPWSRSGTTGP